MIRILLVDDQNLVQQGIKSLLDHDSDFKVIGTVKDGRTAVKQIDVLRPDIVLLDIEMPGMDGITATKYITRLSPNTKVIILSSHEDKKYLTQALMAGAKAYILKTSLMKDLRQAILAVHGGYSHIESRLLAKIFDPTNLKLRSSKTESEIKKTNHQIPQSSNIPLHRPPKTPINLAPEEVDAAVTAKHSIPSQDEVSQVGNSDAPIVEQSEGSKRQRSTTPTIIDAPEVNLEVNTNTPSLKPLDVVEQNSLATANKSDHNHAQVHYNILSEDQEKTASPTINPLLPAVIIQRSSLKLKPNSKAAFPQLSALVLRSKNYLHDIYISSKPQILKYRTQIKQFYQLKKSQWEPIVRSLKVKIVQYQSQLSPIIKRWYQKGWLTNAGLVLLGLITVVIIQRMFS